MQIVCFARVNYFKVNAKMQITANSRQAMLMTRIGAPQLPRTSIKQIKRKFKNINSSENFVQGAH